MVHKKFCLCFVHVIVVLVLCSSVLALDSSQIAALRARTLKSKAQLRGGDTDTIAGFIRAGLDELLYEEDAWEAVNIRNSIMEQGPGAELTPYGSAFIDAAGVNIKSALADLNQITDPERRLRTELNLLIIAASVKSPEMADIGLGRIGASNPTVAYWAVQTVASVEIAKQLKSPVTGDEDLANRITQSLQNAVGPGTFPETLRLMVVFADELGTPDARGLLVKIADVRAAAYANWKVKYELMDGILLSAIGTQILTESAATEKQKLWQRFGQLYSYVIERYVLGQNVLRVEQKQQLASVIVGVENGVISKLIGRSENRLKKAVEDGKLTAVESQRKFLLGSATQEGQLQTKLGVSYGKDAGGKVLTGPRSLKAPPAPPVTNK